MYKNTLATLPRHILKSNLVTPLNSVPRDVGGAPSPTAANIPPDWGTVYLGPGRPFTPFEAGSYRDRLSETEPRSFEYLPYVNANISPRIAYGLMPFNQLLYYRETVPEVALCVRVITQELNSFIPHIYNGDGELVADDPQVIWLTQYPDRVTPFPAWISTLLDGLLTYDAPALYRVFSETDDVDVNKVEGRGPIVVKQRRPGAKITALRIVDGSTLYLLIDERGEVPNPPLPAFTQIIWGTPKQFFSSEQIWYRPRQRRVNAPYGRSPIEDALQPILLLSNMWVYETNFFTEGTMPESWLVSPQGWTAPQALAYEQALNDRMTGNLADRRRMRVIPYGMEPKGQKNAEFREASYKQARERVFTIFGVPPAEMGETPRMALGGRGYMEAMAQIWYRGALAPLKRFIEGMFNEVLDVNGFTDYQFVFDFPSESLDPGQQETKYLERWTAGLASRNETRQSIGMDAVAGPAGQAFLNPRAIGVAGNPDNPDQGAGGAGDAIPPEDKPGAVGDAEKVQLPFDLEKHCGVCPEDDEYFGAPALKTADIPMPHEGANESEVIAVKPAGLPARPAVFKPEGEEQDWMRERVGGELAPREEAAYLIDRALAFYLVPVSYVAYVNGERGAVILYVRGNSSAQPLDAYDESWIEKAGAFDCVVSQLDRREPNNQNRPTNYLTHPDEPRRPVLIDNGLTFPDEPLFIHSPFYDAWEGKDLSPNVLDALIQLKDNSHVWSKVRDLVGSRPVELAQARLDSMLDSGKVVGEEVYLETMMKQGLITPSEYAALKEKMSGGT